MSRTPLAAAVAVAGVLAWLPFELSGYHQLQAAGVAVYVMAILGLNVLTGYTGQISIGHGALMAVGAYTTAILVAHHGWSGVATMPLAALVGFGAGAVVGLPALRLSGAYLALVSFAAALAVPQLAKKFSTFTGGTQGLPVESHTGRWLYGVSWAAAALLWVLAWLLLRGRTGRAFRAIRDSDVAATSSGVSLPLYKPLAFAISGAFAGVAGSAFALVNGFINPDAFPLLLSLYVLIGAAVGGLGSLWGVLAGAAFVQLLPNVLSTTNTFGSPDAAPVIFGATLALVMILVPGGAAGLLLRVVRGATNRAAGRHRV